MEKKSRFELIKIVEAQKEQLTRYETRLRDVVHAYKNLLREKDALEASVNVLTTSTNHAPKSLQKEVAESEADPHTEGNGRNESKKTNKEEGAKNPLKGESVEGKEVLDHPLAVKENEVEGEDQSQLAGKENNSSLQAELDTQQEKVATLSASLATVMQQKSKMEASYQADKKKMMQEHEVKNQEHEQEIEKLKSNLESLQEQLQEVCIDPLNDVTTSKCRHNHKCKHKHKNQTFSFNCTCNQVVGSAHHQSLSHRTPTCMLAHMLTCNTSENQLRLETNLVLRLWQSEARGRVLENIVGMPVGSLMILCAKSATLMVHQLHPLIRKFHSDLELRKVVTSALNNIVVVNTFLATVFTEVKLSELSEVVGNYEKLRLQDQQAIQKLKDRLHQLDVENVELTRQMSTDENHAPDNEKEAGQDETPEELKEQVMKLKGLLKIALNSADKPLDLELEELSKSEFESVFISDPSHKVCQQQLRQLKEEFERYKVKTQALHKNKSFKELSEQIGNMEKLKLQNEDLEKQLQELKESNNIRELDQKKVITNLRDQLKLTEENYRLEKEEANTVYKQKLEDLERQVLNQRERTLALVAEKDAEIEMLRSRSPSASPSADTRSVFSYQRKFVEMTGVSQASMDLPESSEADAAVHQLLSKNSGVTGSERTLVHYAQQQARREAESTAIRRQKNELEVALRDSELRGDKLMDQANVLKEEIRKLERDRSRESANMEYLKNIVLRFMMSTSYSVKQQMITAIATILQFSPREVQ
ncbi:unnamed protein product [Porites evermanni]|uniref:GRIP domain-containing protein n=1 Tax=Porites evermanni TaxID=104178 RepID=A0ABN8RH68_9CNID|nr:unnamed protein product [Porites evermanni]